VNPVETYIRSGTHAVKPNCPYTPGSDASGVVVQLGEKVNKFKIGDRVYTRALSSGAYAQYATASQDTIYSLPDNVSFEQGAGVNIPYATAYHALFQRGRAKPGQFVLIHGASGAVGTAAIQFGVLHGLQLIGTAGSESGKEVLQKEGVKWVLNHKSETHFEEVLKITKNAGVDVILEMLANVNLANDLKIMAIGGRVCIVGSRGSIQIDPRDAMVKRSEILGLSLHSATSNELTEIHAAIFAGLSNGALKPNVSKTYHLEEASKSHEDVINPPSGGALGKLILLPWSH